MKKIVCFAFAALLCSCTNGGYKLSGTIDGAVAGDSVMIYSTTASSREPLAATVVAEGGVVEFSGEIVEPDMVVMVVNGQTPVGQFVLESGDIKITTEEGASSFEGTPLNAKLSAFAEKRAAVEAKFHQIDPSLTPEEAAAAQQVIYDEYVALMMSVIDENKDNIIGASMFVSAVMNTMESTEAKEFLAGFSPEILARDFMVKASEGIEAALKVEVGNPYIDIKLANVDGDQVAVSELLADGKYVLIDFWATWCGPCMGEMPHLKTVYADYKDKGFEIYGVSLDRDVEAWKKMATESLEWVNVINSADADASTVYAVRSIPTNFLISPEGVIVAKNLRGEEVATKLAEYIK